MYKKACFSLIIMLLMMYVSATAEYQIAEPFGNIEADGLHVTYLYLEGDGTDVAIPEEYDDTPIISLEAGALDELEQIESLYIPASVKHIDEGVFANHKSITLIVEQGSAAHQYAQANGLKYQLPESKAEATEQPTAFESAQILDGVYEWEDYKYKLYSNGNAVITGYDGNTTDLTLPSQIDGHRVVAIGTRAFSYEDFTSVRIPDTVCRIDTEAFYDCDELTSIVIPDSVTEIGRNPFRECYKIAEINVSAKNPVLLSFKGGLIDWNEKRMILYSSASSKTRYSIPYGITTIDAYAFEMCETLKNIEIPDSVTNISAYAFRGCSSLESIAIPDSVTSIGAYAFLDCNALKRIDIPDGVTIIDDCTFCGCLSLENIRIPNSVTSIGECAFDSCRALTRIDIPDSVTSIRNSAFSFCRNDIVLTVGCGSYAEQYAIDKKLDFEVRMPNKKETTAILLDEVYSWGRCTYQLYSNGKALITSYTGDDNYLEIPTIINGYKVTGIADRAFSQVKYIIIPENFKPINETLFANLKGSLPIVEYGSAAYQFAVKNQMDAGIIGNAIVAKLKAEQLAKYMGKWFVKDDVIQDGHGMVMLMPGMHFTLDIQSDGLCHWTVGVGDVEEEVWECQWMVMDDTLVVFDDYDLAELIIHEGRLTVTMPEQILFCIRSNTEGKTTSQP